MAMPVAARGSSVRLTEMTGDRLPKAGWGAAAGDELTGETGFVEGEGAADGDASGRLVDCSCCDMGCESCVGMPLGGEVWAI